MILINCNKYITDITDIKMNNFFDSGKLHILIGPMFSGKTSELINNYNKYKYCNLNVKVINYIFDNRYTDKQLLYTHDKREVPCILTENLNDVYNFETCNGYITNENSNSFNETHIFLINEAQFFKDIVNWVKIAISPPYNKIVYLAGLDGDFKRELFGNWLELIPMCDTITKLSSICSSCKKRDAIFSHRLTNDTNQELIGNDIYKPLCRLCYENEMTYIQNYIE